MTSSGTNQLLNAEPASFCVIFNQIPKHGFWEPTCISIWTGTVEVVVTRLKTAEKLGL